MSLLVEALLVFSQYVRLNAVFHVHVVPHGTPITCAIWLSKPPKRTVTHMKNGQ
jgi:hypothetical protein